MADWQHFTLEKHDDRTATLHIDRRDAKVNAFNAELMGELRSVLESLARRDDLRFLFIRSDKPNVFIAGADIRDIQAIEDEADAEQKSGGGQTLFDLLDDLPFPTMALIDGACLGGGTEFALACDYRIATDNPKVQIGLPETQLGILPGWGGTWRMPRLVGPMQALNLILTGKSVDGAKAARIKLVDFAWPHAFHVDWAHELASRILEGDGRKEIEARRRRKKLGLRLLENNPIGRALIYSRALKDTRKKTGGHYPAPIEALRVVKRTYGKRRSAALRIERTAFGRLAVSSASRNLVRLYFAREAVNNQAALQGKGKQVESAAVLGAGVMGGRISWLFSYRDIPVVMKDIDWEAVRKGYQSAHEVYGQLRRIGKLDERETALKMHRIHGTVNYGSLGSPDFVVEAVVENLEIKKKVLSELEAQVRDDTIIATNSSALSITEMSKALKRPERFVGMHFFNPVNRMPLVEVIAGEATSADTVRATGLLAQKLGKTPVVVQNCPGFLVNRLLMPYLNEAVVMLHEGFDFLDIDRKLKSFGMPMGPFTLLDEVGIDVAFEVAKECMGAYGDRMQTSPFFDAIEGNRELLGRKSGQGFFLYGDTGRRGKKSRRKRPEPNPAMQKLIREHTQKSAKPISEFDLVHRPVLALINEAARALEEKIVDTPTDVDIAMIMGTGFPPFRGGALRYADDSGVRRTRDILSDYAERFGHRFRPADLLQQLAAEGRSFYDLQPPRES